MAGDNSDRKELAIEALLSSRDVPSAAKMAGISERTLWRYLAEDEFQKDYREARRKAVAHGLAGVQAACSEAVGTLRDVMSNVDSPAQARVSAARCVLEMAIKVSEMDDLSERIQKLEGRI